MRREPKASTATALIVHGVGPFEDGPAVVRDVKAQLKRKGIAVSQVIAFDWNAIVGSQSDQVPGVARAIFRLIRLRVDNTRRVVSAFRLLSCFALQFAMILFPPALILCLYSTRHLVLSLLLALAGSKFLSALRVFSIELPLSILRQRIFQRWCLMVITAVVAIGISERLMGREFIGRRISRQLALILGWPVIYATVVLGYSKVPWVIVSAATPFLMFAGLMALGGLGNLAFHTGTHQGFFDWALVFLAVATFVFAVALAMALVLKPFFAAFKRFADVLLWLGDLPYRRRLRLNLTRIVREMARGNQELLLIGHSLGTVLLIDYLMTQIVRRRGLVSNRIRLVTFGSPLKSLIAKYYPETFPSPLAVFDALVASHPDFGWVNGYRPADYIGREVGLRATPRSADLSTNEHNLRGLATHSNYWSDPVVWDTVGPALNGMKDLKPSKPDLEEEGISIWPSDHVDDDSPMTMLANSEKNRVALGWVIKTLIFSAIPLFACIAIILVPFLQYRAVSSRAIETGGQIFCSVAYHDGQVAIPNSSGSYSVVSCTVSFTDHNGGGPHLKPVDGIDFDGLPPKYDHTLGRGFQVEGDDVKIAYQPNNPDNVVVKSGTVHNADDTHSFRLLVTPGDRLFTRIFGVVITSAVFTLLLLKPLFALTVAVESFFGINSGAYRDGLSE